MPSWTHDALNYSVVYPTLQLQHPGIFNVNTDVPQAASTMFILLISALLTFTISSLYIIHRTLGSKLHASHHSTIPPTIAARIHSIPEDVLASKDTFSVFYDRASRPVARRLLPDIPVPFLLTCLLRRNLATFAHFPQAWILRLSTPSRDRCTFSSNYVQSLDFKENELVCGVYRVAARRENQVELAMSRGAVTGRLVIGYESDEDKGMVVFSTETIMWIPKDKGGSIPLENPVLRFFHEMTAWWLIDSGVRFLLDLEGTDSDERTDFED